MGGVSNVRTDGEAVAEGDTRRWRFAPTPAIPHLHHRVSWPGRSTGVRTGTGDIEPGPVLPGLPRPPPGRAPELLEVTTQGFDFFHEGFDQPYPFGTKYDQVFVPEYIAGAMENAGW